MRAVIQRVRACTVSVSGERRAHIDEGILIYLGIGHDDTRADADYTANKCAYLRIFPDDRGVPNRSVLDHSGQALVISQFTLYGDTRKGRRPSYNGAAKPDQAQPLYERFLAKLRDTGLKVGEGEFRAHMEITYTNDGPVTILLDSAKTF